MSEAETDIVEKLKVALEKVKNAYIEQKRINKELVQKLNEVSFGRDELLKENRELKKKLESINSERKKKETEITSLISELDSLIDEDKEFNLDTPTNISKKVDIVEDIEEKSEDLVVPTFDTQTSLHSSSKIIDDSIEFNNVEDLLNSLNDDDD